MAMSTADRRSLLHILRNPATWSDDVQREVRLKAAKELERLWTLELDVEIHAANLDSTLKSEGGIAP